MNTETEFDHMIQLLDTAWYLRSQIVPCLVGPPGIGKTAAVMQHASKHGANVIKIVASRCVPSETVGMTMPDHDNRSMTIYNSMQLSSLRDGDILFLDELLEADQYVLSTLLTVIESREMADGTPLPDIQIIAATNDTVSPENLKGNIRQRFMFQRFSLDTAQTGDYIRKVTGIVLSNDVLSCLNADGTDYNFLTPRSLTKLCMWMDAVPKEKRASTATVINMLWNTSIGSRILEAITDRDNSPEKQIKNEVRKMLFSERDCPPVDIDTFESSTMGELLEMLKGLEDWRDIETRLAGLQIEEGECDEEIRY